MPKGCVTTRSSHVEKQCMSRRPERLPDMTSSGQAIAGSLRGPECMRVTCLPHAPATPMLRGLTQLPQKRTPRQCRGVGGT
ncbi:hypothetical protein XFF4834R_chr27960 [Xanthomonas citri pv. fuscans]|nr:hypothetical protein XFF4834R_chr27960 [Xanthomonas citri pv. fuscans]